MFVLLIVHHLFEVYNLIASINTCAPEWSFPTLVNPSASVFFVVFGCGGGGGGWGGGSFT